jgi:hypothetical protein
MSKRHRHRKPDDSGHADRVAKYHAIVAELSIQSGRPVDDLRVIDAAWCRLAAENMREQILHGLPTEIGDLERAAAVLNSILPTKPTELTVKFIDQGFCKTCKAALSPDELAEIEETRQGRQTKRDIAPVDNAPAVPADAPAVTPAAKPPPSPPAPPPNELPLRSVHDHVAAPLKRDEPWRSSIGSEFRRFDTPESV